MEKVIIWFAFFAVFASSCGSFNSRVNLNSNEGNLEKIPSDTLVDTSKQTIIPDYDIDSGCKTLLLEIVIGRYGMVLPQGKILEFRIIRSGQAEFDSYEDNGHITRTRHQISQKQVDTLVRLIDFEKLRSPKSTYVTGSPCLDATFEKTLRFCPSTDRSINTILIKECRPLDSLEVEEVPFEIRKIVDYIDKVKE